MEKWSIFDHTPKHHSSIAGTFELDDVERDSKYLIFVVRVIADLKLLVA